LKLLASAKSQAKMKNYFKTLGQPLLQMRPICSSSEALFSRKM
jgi:hypothetical protein